MILIRFNGLKHIQNEKSYRKKTLFIYQNSIVIFICVENLSILRCNLTWQMEGSARLPVEKELTRVRPVVSLAASTVQRIRDRCAYGWVQLQNLTVAVWWQFKCCTILALSKSNWKFFFWKSNWIFSNSLLCLYIYYEI